MAARSPTAESTWWEEHAPLQPPARFDPDRPPDHIAQRYKVLGFLGRGGPSTVWRCLDQLEGDEVAVKVLSALNERELASVRREAVALRWARLPGVVRLRDELRIGDDWFLVMDLVSGCPFPGADGPVSWASLEPFARRLLEVLGTLHDAGVVHGDLKPSNVFILPEREDVVLLDLGLASGRSVARTRGGLRFAGTPNYAAPEQLGGTVDHRADLFAVGVMLSYALTGTIPLHHPEPLVMVSRRAREAAPSIGLSVPGLPRPVVELIDALLASKAQDRPESAWLALERIGGRAPAPLSGSFVLPEGRLDDAALRALVHGPDAFLHLREDTARVLYARTGGQPEAVREELAAWLRAGLGRWEDGALRIERPAIARLEAGEALVPGPAIEGESADLRLLIGMAHPYATVEALSAALGRDVRQEVEGLIAQGVVWPVGEALGSRPVRALGRGEAVKLRVIAESLAPTDPARVELLFRGGAGRGEVVAAIEGVVESEEVVPERALAMLRPHLSRARAEGDSRGVLTLLEHWVRFSLAMEAPAPVERALFEVQRAMAEAQGDKGSLLSLSSQEALLKACLAVWSRDLPSVRSQLEGLGPFERVELEAWRCGIQVELARTEGEAAWDSRLEALHAWAEGSTERQARLDGWLGNRRYAQGRFAESARLHERAAAGKAGITGRLSSLRNAASAWMEAGEPGVSALQAEQIAQMAGLYRLPRLEALAVWCERGAKMRLGQVQQPSEELVEAAFQVHPVTGAMMALGEACSAWRARDLDRAARLARSAARGFEAAGASSGAILATLIVLASHPAPDPSEVERLVESARGAVPLKTKLQVLAILGRRLDRADLQDEAAVLARRWRASGESEELDLTNLADLVERNLPTEK